MKLIVHLELHRPLELRKDPPGRLRQWVDLVDESATKSHFSEAYNSCYSKLFKLLEELKPLGFKVSARVSGSLLEQAERWGRQLLDRLSSLLSLEVLELATGPYFNSPPLLVPPEEYVEQLITHAKRVEELFGVKPFLVSNPYMIYSDEVGELTASTGVGAVLAEGTPRVLAWRAPHFVYKHPLRDICVLFRDHELSNKVAFGLGKWLTASVFAEEASKAQGHVVVVGVPAETFGLAVPESKGALDFLRWLPREVAKRPWVSFSTFRDVVALHEPVDAISVSCPVSWLETKDLKPLTDSPLQQLALSILAETWSGARDAGLIDAWRVLAQADLLLASSSVAASAKLVKALCSLRAAVAESSVQGRA